MIQIRVALLLLIAAGCGGSDETMIAPVTSCSSAGFMCNSDATCCPGKMCASNGTCEPFVCTSTHNCTAGNKAKTFQTCEFQSKKMWFELQDGTQVQCASYEHCDSASTIVAQWCQK